MMTFGSPCLLVFTVGLLLGLSTDVTQSASIHRLVRQSSVTSSCQLSTLQTAITSTVESCLTGIDTVQQIIGGIVDVLGETKEAQDTLVVADRVIGKFGKILGRVPSFTFVIQFVTKTKSAVTRIEARVKNIRKGLEKVTADLDKIKGVLSDAVTAVKTISAWVAKAEACLAAETVLEEICLEVERVANFVENVNTAVSRTKEVVSAFKSSLDESKPILWLLGIVGKLKIIIDPLDALLDYEIRIGPITCSIGGVLNAAGALVKKCLDWLEKKIPFVSSIRDIELPGIPDYDIPLNIQDPRDRLPSLTDFLNFVVPKLPHMKCQSAGPCKSQQVCYLTYSGATTARCSIKSAST